MEVVCGGFLLASELAWIDIQVKPTAKIEDTVLYLKAIPNLGHQHQTSNADWLNTMSLCLAKASTRNKIADDVGGLFVHALPQAHHDLADNK